MTAERQEFEAWVNNPDVLQLHEAPSTESENNPYSNPWTAAAWEGWKARGVLEDEEDREEARRRRKRKPRSEAQEPQEQASEPVPAPLEPTTPVNPPEEPLEAPGEILTEISEA